MRSGAHGSSSSPCPGPCPRAASQGFIWGGPENQRTRVFFGPMSRGRGHGSVSLVLWPSPDESLPWFPHAVAHPCPMPAYHPETQDEPILKPPSPWNAGRASPVWPRATGKGRVTGGKGFSPRIRQDDRGWVRAVARTVRPNRSIRVHSPLTPARIAAFRSGAGEVILGFTHPRYGPMAVLNPAMRAPWRRILTGTRAGRSGNSPCTGDWPRPDADQGLTRRASCRSTPPA